MANEDFFRMNEPVNRYFNKIIENLSDLIFVIDQDGSILYSSPSLSIILGYMQDEVIGGSIKELLSLKTAQYSSANLHILFGGPGDVNSFSIDTVNKNGDVKYLQVHSKNLLHDTDINGIVLTCQDITQSIITGRQLAHKEKLLDFVEEITKVGGWEWDIKKREMLWSKETYAIHDYEIDSMAPHSCDLINSSISCYDGEDQKRISSAFENCAQNGTPYDLECRFTSSKGKPLWIRTTGRPVFENGKVIRVIGNIIDITELKLAELTKEIALETARQSEERFHAFMNNTPVIAWAKDENGRYVYLNPNYEKRFNVRLDNLHGKTDAEIWPPDLAEKFRGSDLLILNSGEPEQIESETINADGSISTWLIVKFPYSDVQGGKCIGGIGIDISERKRAINALMESEERFREIIEGSHEIFFQQHLADGRFKYVSPKVEEILGYSQREIQGWDLAKQTEILHPDDSLVIDKYLDMLLNKSGSLPTNLENEFRLKTKNGSFIWLKGNYTLLYDYNGQPECISGCLKDITDKKEAEIKLLEIQEQTNKKNQELERKNEELRKTREATLNIIEDLSNEINDRKLAEEALKQNEEKFRNYVEAAPGGIFVVNKSGFYLDVNNAAELITGYSRDELLKMHLTNLVYPEDISLAENHFRAVVQTGEAFGELRYVIKTGEVRFWDIKAVKLDEDKYLGFVYDITERKQSESELRNLSRAVEQSPVMIVITNPEGLITYVNPKTCDVTGYSREELLGQNPRIFSSGELPQSTYKKLWETISSGGEWEGEFHNRKKNGELFWESALISPIMDELGALSHYLAIEEDITEWKEMQKNLIAAREKAEEMNRVKSSFFANMSHELRTPMIGILGYAELLYEKSSDLEVREFAHIIHNGGQRLMETLNLILNMSRIEAGKLKLTLCHVDLIDLIKEVVGLFQETAARKNLYLRLKCHTGSLPVKTDPTMLRQIINNLVNNALKYTQAGGVEINIPTCPEVNDGFFKIEVSDTGIGIAPEHQSLIWEEFRQVSEGKGRSFEGTGLGLSITKNFVEKLNGRISVSSILGQGSTFTVELPVSAEKTAFEPKTLSDDKSLTPPKKLPKTPAYKVLYVEDDPVAVSLVTVLLQSICKIEAVNSCESAMLKVATDSYSAILMDINLGKGPDGVETTKRIRSIGNYAKIPIIALTAFAAETDKEDFLSAGCSHYLSKPFKNDELIAMMIEIINNAGLPN